MDALIASGAPQDVIDAARGATAPSDFEVWPENEDAVDAFLELGNAWDWVAPGMGAPRRVGIRATEIESTLRLLGHRVSRRKELFRDIRVMERAALEAMAPR